MIAYVSTLYLQLINNYTGPFFKVSKCFREVLSFGKKKDKIGCYYVAFRSEKRKKNFFLKVLKKRKVLDCYGPGVVGTLNVDNIECDTLTAGY